MQKRLRPSCISVAPVIPRSGPRSYPGGKRNTDQEHTFSPQGSLCSTRSRGQTRGTYPAQNHLVWPGLPFLKGCTEDFGEEAFS